MPPCSEHSGKPAVGEFVADFNATDSEANATLSYSLADGNGSSGNAFFSIDVERDPADCDCARSRGQRLAFDPGTGERRAQLFKRRNLHRSGAGHGRRDCSHPRRRIGTEPLPDRHPRPPQVVILYRICLGG